ncbi:hypothetical protein A7E78_03315 [Syntrophotalea acetylenivorans]|uniref:Fibronectin type-III domain-containing protein n=2 Tax=Syntrophotalea acetylenivorans TaxID=1842532 RepID=A0A1L3GLX0_9BACT|nr:hypothetical protein A7E78_03315 [Syntrophotalea acetylenivorans]
MILVAVMLLLPGCGGGGGGGGGGSDSASVSGGTSGVAVDPYIVGAVFEEVSPEEQVLQRSSISDAEGNFRFPQTIRTDSTIRIKEDQKGTHAGKPYEGSLRGIADHSGALVASPLTTLLANGFSSGQVIAMLEDAGISGLQEGDLYNDPMVGLAGLETFTDDDLVLLQASMAVNSFLLRLDNFNYGPGDPGVVAYLGEAADMVKYGLSLSRYQEVQSELSDTLIDFSSPVTLDHLISATSNTVETLTIAARDGDIADPVDLVGEIAVLNDSLTELTLHYYVLENRGDAAIEEAVNHDILPDIDGTQYPQLDLAGDITVQGVIVPEPEPTTYPAPILDSVEVDGSSFVLNWSLPAGTSDVPSGGYDIIIDSVDTGTDWRTTATSTVITGLSSGVAHTFKVQARWLQADPHQVPLSNELSETIPADTSGGDSGSSGGDSSDGSGGVEPPAPLAALSRPFPAR